MTATKPPTPQRVSATLRTAGFGAAGPRRDEGYKVAWHGYTPCVAVKFAVRDAGEAEAASLFADALTKMAAALRQKGWLVRQYPAFLVVEEA
jgi:hypothetical protein